MEDWEIMKQVCDLLAMDINFVEDGYNMENGFGIRKSDTVLVEERNYIINALYKKLQEGRISVEKYNEMRNVIHRKYSEALDDLHKKGKLIFIKENPKAEQKIEEVWKKELEVLPYVRKISELEVLKQKDSSKSEYYQQQIDTYREALKPKMLEYAKMIGINISPTFKSFDGTIMLKSSEKLQREIKEIENNYFGFSGGYNMAEINKDNFGMAYDEVYEELNSIVMDKYYELMGKAAEREKTEQEYKNKKDEETRRQKEAAERRQKELREISGIIGMEITPVRFESDGVKIYQVNKTSEQLENEMYQALEKLNEKVNSLSPEEFKKMQSRIEIEYKTMRSNAWEREEQQDRKTISKKEKKAYAPLTKEKLEEAKKIIDRGKILTAKEAAERRQKELREISGIIGMEITPVRFESDGERLFQVNKTSEQLEEEEIIAYEKLKQQNLTEEERKKMQTQISVLYNGMINNAFEREEQEKSQMRR